MSYVTKYPHELTYELTHEPDAPDLMLHRSGASGLNEEPRVDEQLDTVTAFFGGKSTGMRERLDHHTLTTYSIQCT